MEKVLILLAKILADKKVRDKVLIFIGSIVVGFLLLLDSVTPHMHMDEQVEGPRSSLKRTTKLILAVTLMCLKGKMTPKAE